MFPFLLKKNFPISELFGFRLGYEIFVWSKMDFFHKKILRKQKKLIFKNKNYMKKISLYQLFHFIDR